MNEFEAPESGPSAVDVDLADAKPPILVKIAGVVLAVAGAFVAGSGAQLLAFFTLATWLMVVALLMVVAGFAAMGVGLASMRGDGKLAVAGSLLALVLSVAFLAWNLYAVSAFLFSPMMVFALMFSGLSLLLMPLTISAALGVSAARKALYEG